MIAAREKEDRRRQLVELGISLCFTKQPRAITVGEGEMITATEKNKEGDS